MKFTTTVFAFALSVSGASAFATSGISARQSLQLDMSLEKYSDELKTTASAMVQKGKGLLACDESTGTVGSRLDSIGLENNESNRQKVSNK